MKSNKFFLMAAVAIAVTTQSCKTDAVTADPVTSATELISLATTTAPTMDGVIDASWAGCNKLSNKTLMPAADVFGGLYKFFAGEAYTFTLRSMYDASNIYFLVEIDDLTKSVDQRSWYYNTDSLKWKQPFGADGKTTHVISATEKYGEDKFGMAFPISTNGNWDKYTCWSTCHTDKTIKDHYSDDAAFKVDLWHWRSVQSQPSNQLQDGYITYTDGTVSGRKSDTTTNYINPATQKAYTSAEKTNSQSLTVTGKTYKMTVPMYILTTATGIPAITQDDIDKGRAKKVTAVNETGVLTYDGGILTPAVGGGTINPSDGYSKTGTKRIFSVINRGKLEGSIGDVMTYANYIDKKGWVIEVVRSLSTLDKVRDTQFDIAKSYQFGFAVFDNGNGEHGVKPDLKLKFATVASF